MALEEYKRKRRFEATPEPPPKVAKKSSHRFVVQMHDATRLHYDFRLELDGVLKSWAVPKGPSLDPADKRLAMQVEDHPVSYFDFEGVIPEGNYGSGTVMVWDVGTWTPQGDAQPMLKKGDLKFRLDGKKLQGEFALVHIRSRRSASKGNEWLLIKHRDAYSQAGYDIDQYDYSVLTKRTLDQIGGDAGSAEWTSSRKVAVGGISKKNEWLADSIAKADKRNAAKRGSEKPTSKPVTSRQAASPKSSVLKASSSKTSASTANQVKKKRRQYKRRAA